MIYKAQNKQLLFSRLKTLQHNQLYNTKSNNRPNYTTEVFRKNHQNSVRY